MVLHTHTHRFTSGARHKPKPRAVATSTPARNTDEANPGSSTPHANAWASGRMVRAKAGFRRSVWKQPDAGFAAALRKKCHFPPRCCADATRPYFVSMANRPRLRAFNTFAKKVTSSGWFDAIIMTAILAATGLVGIQTYNPVGEVWKWVENIILAVFIAEVTVKMAADGLFLYFTVPWNVFDFLIVLFSLPILPVGGDSVVVLRMLRLLRVAKLVKAIPQLRMIIMGLQSGLSSIFYILVLLILVLYVFAILGLILFRKNDPFHFGTLGSSMITLFRIATLEVSNRSHFVHYALFMPGSPRNTLMRLGLHRIGLTSCTLTFTGAGSPITGTQLCRGGAGGGVRHPLLTGLPRQSGFTIRTPNALKDIWAHKAWWLQSSSWCL